MKPANSTPESQSALRPWRAAPRDVAVLIPAFQPTQALEELIARLVECNVPAILLVDDGTPAANRDFFDRLQHEPRVHILHHPENQGKGAALKTGIRYFLDHLSHYKGLVTADADGQHAAEDILRIARALQKAPRLAITGARTFGLTFAPKSLRGIPLRNLLANRFAAALFRGLTSIPLTDAQTGLRALPTSLLPSLLDLPGARYEYEMEMLMYIARTRHPLAEQPIATSCDLGQSSNFRPIADSLRVLKALFKRRTYAPHEHTPHPYRRSEDIPHTSSTFTLRAK